MEKNKTTTTYITELNVDDILDLTTAAFYYASFLVNEVDELEKHKKTDKPIYTHTDIWSTNAVEITGEKRDILIEHDIKRKNQDYKKFMELHQKLLTMAEERLNIEI